MPLNEQFWQGEKELLYNLLFPLILDSTLTGAENSMIDLVEQIGVGIDWALVNEAARDWAKRYTFELVGGITQTSRNFLQKEISEWIESGKPLDDLIKNVETMFSRNRAEMISITEVTRAFASGNLASWKASGVVDGKKWQTAQDEMVCPICEPLANSETDLSGLFEGGLDSPPAHVRCRCWFSPVVKVNG